MAKKIEIIGSALVVTNTVSGEELLDAPKKDYYYDNSLLEKESIISLGAKDPNLSKYTKRLNIPLADAVNDSLVAFTSATFKTFARENLGFNTASGGSGATGITITQQVNQYVNLVAGDTVGDLAYVENSQGTAWLPGTLGGTYYPAGFYVWDGVNWVSDRNAIANALQTLIDKKEEDLSGSTLEIDPATGTENLDLSTFASAYMNLTGNTTITVTNTPASGNSFVRNLYIKGAFSLTLPASWELVGSYVDDGNPNYLTVIFNNFTSGGTQVTCFISQES